MKPFQHNRSPFWVIGHRGSPLVEVENTLPSFERAVAEGANGVEVDLCVTRDGEVVLWHDYNPAEIRALCRRFGWEPRVAHRPYVPSDGRFRKEVGELTLAELREHFGYAERRSGRRVEAEIPTLSQFLEWAAGKPELGIVFFDIKLPDGRTDLIPTLLAKLDALVDALRPGFRTMLESCEEHVIRELRRLAPERDIAFDVEPPPGLVMSTEGSSAARAAIKHGLRHVTAMKPRKFTLWPFETHMRILEGDLQLVREHNATSPEAPIEGLWSFTINRPHEMRRLIELGISGIQSDVPAVLRKVAEATGRRVDVRSAVPALRRVRLVPA